MMVQSPAPILYLDHAPIWGGAEAVLVTLLQHLDRRQFQPFVATAPDSPLAQRLAGSDVPILPVPFDTLNQAGWRLPLNLARSVTAVTRLIRQHAITLVHTNTVRAHIVGSLAGWLTRTPVVWTLHDNTFPPRLVRWLAPIPRQTIAVSGWLADLYAPCGLTNKITIIPNGLNLAAAPDNAPSIRAELGIPPDAPLVLNVGRLIAGKAPHLFIAAAEIAASHHPDAHFVLVGGPDDGEAADHIYLEQLTQAIAGASLGSRLHAVGPRPDVGRFYQAAAVVVYNAVQPEGLPTVLLEAMAYALPVVAAAVGGALEIVQDGRTGILTPPNDAAALADAIHTLLANPTAQQSMGLAGRERLAAAFSVPQQIQKTTAIYLAVLQGDQP
ncbi:MAG: glycosyltransferase family 4 protein [Chloroflexi bacterium]|nr:glycosyltransferase family 4 protein [Chloroflexota bacterium]